MRSFDGKPFGLVVAEKNEECFIVESTSEKRKYRIPKNKVEAFDG